jgi:hypothetical protein
MCPRRNPRWGRLRVFERMPVKSRVFFRFWDTEVNSFVDVTVCPLSAYRGLPLKPLTLLGAYFPRSKRIYLDDIHDYRTFLHEASHHIVTLRMPHLYKTPRGRAVEEAVADIAAAVSAMRLEVPRGVGWRLIEMGLALKHCRRLRFDEDGDPILERRCILTALRARPKLVTRIF